MPHKTPLALAAAVTALLAAAPAFANHCPQDAEAIDHALSTVKLDDAAKAEIQKLRDDGMAAHDAGNHPEAERLLADAMRRLLMAE